MSLRWRATRQKSLRFAAATQRKTLGVVFWICFLAAPTVAEWRPRNECERCHEIEFKAFAGSAHHLGKVQCQDCHGGNPQAEQKNLAHLPEDKFQGRFDDHVVHCGACHDEVRKHFERGPHSDKFDQDIFDLITCSACHRYHAVEETNETWFKSNCERCHKAEPQRLAPGLALFDLVSTHRVRLSQMETDRQELRGRGFALISESGQMNLLRYVLKSVGPVSHALNSDDTDKMAGSAKPLADAVSQGLLAKREAHRRARRLLLPAWIAFILVAAGLLLASREISERPNQE